MKKYRSGFTLVEIMIVVAIIAILAAIAIPNLLRAKVNANESSAQAALKSISNALETYAAINTNYPSETTSLQGVEPPYLTVDYFDGTSHNGYTFTADLSDYDYAVTATPAHSPKTGTKTFIMTTGGILEVE